MNSTINLTASNLADFYRDKAKEFLKAVVCFDDRAYQAFQTVSTYDAKTAIKPSDGFGDDPQEKTSQPDVAPVQKDKEEREQPKENVLDFDPKALTDAFADMDILCSVIEPDTNETKARGQIVKMSRMADVAILDWRLKNKDQKEDPSITRDSVVDIFNEDEKNNGCLRLIVIYSDGKGEDIISELASLLKDKDFCVSKNNLELQSSRALIVFLPKSQVPYYELPKHVVDSFTRLTSGLLPAAALSAITVIRQQSHHLLATFPADLDGAFLTHRCLIPDPKDAEQYVLDLVEEEIGALLSFSEIREALDGDQCVRWLQEKPFDDKQRIRLQKSLIEYSKAKVDGFRKLFNNTDLSEKEVSEKVLELFYKADHAIAEKAKKDFSILSTLDFHREKIMNCKGRPPRLQLGSIVREMDTGSYLLCIQPLCDSTRVKHKVPTIFPFLILSDKSEKTNPDLCIPDESEAGGAIWLSVLPKPQYIISYKFVGKSKTEEYIEAIDIGNTKNYVFQNADCTKCLEWIADLKIGKAQRIASQLASRIHTLGIDEFEWLRLQNLREN